MGHQGSAVRLGIDADCPYQVRGIRELGNPAIPTARNFAPITSIRGVARRRLLATIELTQKEAAMAGMTEGSLDQLLTDER